MLIVFSDIHLTDGTTARNVHGTAFEMLGEEIEAAVEAKEDVQELQVVLLGDIFDLVRTSYWHAEEAASRLSANDRPWCGKLDPETGLNTESAKVEAQFQAVLDRILNTESSQALVKMLNDLPVIAGAKPKVTYVIGNHDRVFHNFPSLTARLQSKFSEVTLSFARSFESADYGVFARHGHEWDENCHGWDFCRKVLQPGSKVGRFDEAAYRVMGIGEVITAELMSGLIYRIQSKLDPSLADDAEFLETFQEVNNLRPMTTVFDWISWFVRDRGAKYEKYLKLIQPALRDALGATLDSSLAKRWDKLKTDLLASGDITDHLSRAYFLLKQKSGLRLIQGLIPIVSLFQSGGGSGELDELGKGAQEEFAKGAAADEKIQYLLYGHTHDARQDCFRGTHAGQVRLYVNTGTFLPFIDRAHGHQGFWSAHRMTYAFLFRDDEDRKGRKGPGPTLDVWDGLRRKRYAV